MQYLVLILGGIIGFLIYYIYKKENTKTCKFCGETIKKQAIICKHCGRELITLTELVMKSAEQLKEELIDNNPPFANTTCSVLNKFFVYI